MFDFLKKIFKREEKREPEVWDNKLQKTVPKQKKEKK